MIHMIEGGRLIDERSGRHHRIIMELNLEISTPSVGKVLSKMKDSIQSQNLKQTMKIKQ